VFANTEECTHEGSKYLDVESKIIGN